MPLYKYIRIDVDALSDFFVPSTFRFLNLWEFSVAVTSDVLFTHIVVIMTKEIFNGHWLYTFLLSVNL